MHYRTLLEEAIRKEVISEKDLEVLKYGTKILKNGAR